MTIDFFDFKCSYCDGSQKQFCEMCGLRLSILKLSADFMSVKMLFGNPKSGRSNICLMVFLSFFNFFGKVTTKNILFNNIYP